MATLLQLPTRRRSASAPRVAPDASADILLFTGIRYERPAPPPAPDGRKPGTPDPLGRDVRPS